MTITIYCTINIIIIIRSVLTIIIIIIFFLISNGNTCRTEWSPIQSVITRAFKKNYSTVRFNNYEYANTQSILWLVDLAELT